MKLKVLDLFSGIGGFSLGLERTGGFETVAFCEIDPFCQKVLKKHWPDTPIYNDVRNLNYDGAVDVITGGYPCQPFSVAGKRRGKEDVRHLWPAMFDLIKKHRPCWVVGENVTGHIKMGLDDVLSNLEDEDYSARAFVVPAIATDARHQRDRLWIVGNLNGSNGYREGRPKGQDKNFAERKTEESIKEWDKWVDELVSRNVTQRIDTYAEARRSLDGIPNRLDRHHALGNAVVPQIPEMIGYAILEANK